MTDSLDIRRVALAYRLGELTLASVPLRLAIRSSPLSAAVAAQQQSQRPRLPPLLDGNLPPECDGWFLPNCPVDEQLTRLAIKGGRIRYVISQYARYYTDLSLDQAAYLKKFSAKSRGTMLRKVRRLADRSGGKIDWREYRNPEEMREFLRLAREVSCLTYQERLLHAGLPSGESFASSVMHAAAREQVRGYLLFVDGKAVSYLYTPIRDRNFVYEFLGHDPGYSDLSVGTVLQWLVLQHLVAEGGHGFFDFTAGASTHKRFFSTNNLLCADIYFLRFTPRNLVLILAHWILIALSDGGVAALDRLGFKSKIKRILRSRWRLNRGRPP